jgi:hypothetical protein
MPATCVPWPTGSSGVVASALTTTLAAMREEPSAAVKSGSVPETPESITATRTPLPV